MANNAAVEKLKALGLRHGEKAVVGLAAALCLLFLFKAATRETIDITPDQVREHATAAKNNINRHQDDEAIIQRLETEFLKKPEFEKQVDKLATTSLDASVYKPKTPWVYREPGAGLLRDQPELIAVSELYAYPGRGGALVYDLDEDGNRKPDDGKGLDEDTLNRRKVKRKRRSPMGGGGMMGGMMGGGQRKRPQKSQAELAREEAERLQAEKEAKERSLVGKGAKVEIKDASEEQGTAGGNFKEVTKGLRWVALTGTLDHKKLRENYANALKRTDAQPHFRQGLDLQRQKLQEDGTWSDWEDVDRDKNNQVLDNFPEEDEELTPEEVRLDALVDPLPFLKAGYWERVHVASLVPKEKKEIVKPKTNDMARGGMMGQMGRMMMPGMMGEQGGMMNSAQMGQMGRMMMPGMMGEGMMGEGMGGPAEDTNFQKTEAETVMIRALDFTADPDATYRYRVRIVVFNPNKAREDVNAGVDTKSEYLEGPWSEATGPVTMPADVTPYAMATVRAGSRPDEVSFQVTRWTPEDGSTVVRNFEAAPGEPIGDIRSARIPSSEGKGARSSNIDFNSREVVVDTDGGPKPLPPIGATGGSFDVPALSLLVRPDGTVVVRSQANDVNDDVRRDIDSNYKKEVAESTKKRKNSQGGGYSGMMGGMMGGNAAMPGMGVGGGYR